MRGLAAAVVLLAAALAAAQVGCEVRQPDTTPPSFGEPCASDEDCIAPFTCIGTQLVPNNCSKPCATDADCPRYHWSPPCSPNIDADVKSMCYANVCTAYIACH